MLRIQHFSPQVCQHYQAQADSALLPLISKAAALFASQSIKAVSNDWLAQQSWKRVIGLQLTEDLFGPAAPRRTILDVGGGLSAFTLELARQHAYTLLELATHEDEGNYRAIEKLLDKPFLTLGDWHDFRIQQPYDVIIANDLFPNVDQRLYAFIDRFLPWTNELRMTLTYYENTYWTVRRVTSGETLIVRPWGLREVTAFLDHLVTRYPEHCPDYDRGQLVYQDYEKVLFTNRRNIIRLHLVKEKT